MADHTIRTEPRRIRAAAASCAIVLIVMLTDAVSITPLPSAGTPAPAAAIAPAETTPVSETPTALIRPTTAATEPAGRALPEPRVDPAAALRYSNFLEGLVSIAIRQNEGGTP